MVVKAAYSNCDTTFRAFLAYNDDKVVPKLNRWKTYYNAKDAGLLDQVVESAETT
jgi:hypothetical protein